MVGLRRKESIKKNMRWVSFGSALDGEAKRASMNNEPMTVLGWQDGTRAQQGCGLILTMGNPVECGHEPSSQGSSRW